MNIRKFRELLEPHFNREEIGKLITYGKGAYMDAMEEKPGRCNPVVYEFMIVWLMDRADDLENFNAEFANVIGRELTIEEFDKLTDDMDYRWD